MRSLKVCRSCQYQWYDDFELKSLKKVDFIWVNRDFDAFEWFIELLGEITLQQNRLDDEPFIEIHLYMTSAKVAQEISIVDSKKVDDLKKKALLKELNEEKNKNFSLKLNPGRPNLTKVFLLILFGACH